MVSPCKSCLIPRTSYADLALEHNHLGTSLLICKMYVSLYQVVDLLIAMANAAAHSARANLILDPYPSVVDPVNPHQLAMDPKVSLQGHTLLTVVSEVLAISIV